ncbi:hypothetical protein [Niabella beijingensis]|uniref:hypothetical protein n=1 Tax=Niabella beijingensis TaxID=2872700 RepID=UPI001CBB12EB|nr:hypothetical protein [Niabella beijingensis]MBZ4188199.1 hypothetical protein [Niabella beijingensis]
MKSSSKIILAALLISTLALGACSRTKDALGLDTMYNAISVGKWYHWTSTVTPGASVNNLQEGQYLTFGKSNGTAYVYNADGSQVTGSKHTYEFLDTKRMVFDGVTYEIKENFAGSFKTLTLENKNGSVTTTQALER